MPEKDQNIEKITLEARKAYRFLFQYQQRILDLMSFIGGSLGLNYSGGWPKFSNPAPRSGGGNLNNWAWDWLNMYFYEFHFESKGANVKFSAFIVNDTGFYDALVFGDRTLVPKNRLDMDKYETIEKSETKLILVAAKNIWPSSQWGEWQSQEFLNKDLIHKQDDGIMISKIYSLGSFATQDDAIQSLNDFCQYCHNSEIPISIQDTIVRKNETSE